MKAFMDTSASMAVVGFDEQEAKKLAKWTDDFKAGRAELILKTTVTCSERFYNRVSLASRPALPATITPAMVQAAQSALCGAVRDQVYFTSAFVTDMLQKVIAAAPKGDA